MATLLLADHDNQSIKDTTARALSAAVALGAPVTVLVAGHNARAAADAAATFSGVAKVVLVDDALYANQLAEPMAALIVSMASSYSAIVSASTTSGKNIMPRVAALLDVMQISDVIRVASEIGRAHV